MNKCMNEKMKKPTFELQSRKSVSCFHHILREADFRLDFETEFSDRKWDDEIFFRRDAQIQIPQSHQGRISGTAEQSVRSLANVNGGIAVSKTGMGNWDLKVMHVIIWISGKMLGG